MKAVDSPLCCQCGHAMILDGVNDGMRGPIASFHCSNCEQQAHVYQDGSGGMTLANLFPSTMTPRQHWEFADYQAGEKRMYARMRVMAGWMTEDEYVEFDQGMSDAVERYRTEHPLPTSLWARIRARFA